MSVQSRVFLAVLVLLSVGVLAGEAADCQICHGTGVQVTVSPIKITDTRATGDNSVSHSVERMETRKDFCPGCESGKAVCREAYQLMQMLPGHVEKNLFETQRQVPGWKNRVDTAQKQLDASENEINELRNSKADVRDQIVKMETRLTQLKAEIEKGHAKQLELDRSLADLKVQQAFCKDAGELVKRRLSDFGETVPTTEKRAAPGFPVRNFTDLVSAASPILKKGSSAAPANPGAPVAPANAGDGAAPAAKKGVKTYVLNDGRRLAVKIAMENGDDYMLKCDDGKTITVKKADVKGIEQE
jgi:TolA-binding protein